MILATRFTFIAKRNLKNMWPLTTYDVIYRNHSNWQSLNFSVRGINEQLLKTSAADVLYENLFFRMIYTTVGKLWLT